MASSIRPADKRHLAAVVFALHPIKMLVACVMSRCCSETQVHVSARSGNKGK